jgi:outer membrane protein TolC
MKAGAAILIAGLGTIAAAAAEPWTLDRALGFAQTNSPDARIALQRVAAAQAGIEQANSAVWPKLSLQSSYMRTDSPMMSFGNILNQRSYSPGINFNDVPATDDMNVRGVLTMPLYTGGKIAAEKHAAKAGSAAARQDAEAIRQTLAGEVARAFFTVQKTRQFIAAAQAAITSYETNTALARKRFDAGSALRADVLDLEVRLAQAQEDLIRARNAKALAQRALQNLLGLEEKEFSVADTAPALTAPAAGTLANRPESVAAAERARAAEAQVRSAKSGYIPRVNAFGSLDYDYGWVMNGDGKSYTGGVMLQWDLWDGRLTRAKVSEARSNLESAREQERKVRLAVSLEAEQARLDLEQAQQRLQVGEKTVAQAEESLSLTGRRFAEGAALATQLIDAQTALTAARVRRADALADVQIATAALRKALGLSILETK